MKKKLTSLIIAVVVAATLTVPALACTPPLNPPASPHIEFNWEPSEGMQEAFRKSAEDYIKEHPIDLKKETETETEVVTETETVIESEVETDTAESEEGTIHTRPDWSKYIPEGLRSRWTRFIRR